MRCPKCGNEVENDWKFCPYCGFNLINNNFDEFNELEDVGEIKKMFDFDEKLEEMISRMMDEVKNMNRFMNDLGFMDISSLMQEDNKEFFKNPIVKGFSVRIDAKSGEKPRVSVRTFGDVDREKVIRNVLEKMGIGQLGKREKEKRMEEKKSIKLPETMEEPEHEVRRIDDTIVIEIMLPGVKSMDDIMVKEFENSVEVRALAENKGYFKIIAKPRGTRLKSSKFKDGILRLEISMDEAH